MHLLHSPRQLPTCYAYRYNLLTLSAGVHMRPETELGDNDTVKKAAPVESSRSARKRYAPIPFLRHCWNSNPSEADAAQQPKAGSEVPVFYSALKRAHKERVVPELREEDLEEQFVRGVYLLSLHPPYELRAE